MQWGLVAQYAAFLAVAVLGAHYLRSRRFLIGTAALSVLLLGLVATGCVCPVGALQNVILAVLHPEILVPLSLLLLFFLPIVVALFYGRVFCSAVCPLGAVQELTARFPVQMPHWLDRSLSSFRYIYLGAVVLFLFCGLPFLLCRFDPYVGIFRMSGMVYVLYLTGGMLLLGLFIGRPYCRFLCPYGAILGWCSRVSAHNVRVTPGDCSNCKLCEKVCPYGAILPPTKLPTPEESKNGPWRLLLVLLAVPVLIFGMSLLARQGAMSMAMFHPDVALTQNLLAEETGVVPDRATFENTEAFYNTGVPNAELYARAGRIYQHFLLGTTLFGAWVGLVIGGKLIQSTLRRRREEYSVDPSRCVSCGRCFWYCPNQKGDRVLLQLEQDDKQTDKEP